MGMDIHAFERETADTVRAILNSASAYEDHLKQMLKKMIAAAQHLVEADNLRARNSRAAFSEAQKAYGLLRELAVLLNEAPQYRQHFLDLEGQLRNKQLELLNAVKAWTKQS